MAMPTYAAFLLRLYPPWLQRTVGEKLMLALGSQVDVLYERGRQSVKHRFPLVVDESSLARIGAERRIRRGPGESATTYARRLQWWWDDHRVRGAPYPLLRQLYFFFFDVLNVRKDVVYHSGTRRWMAGGVVASTPAEVNTAITRDSVTWDADGTDEWAQFWVFFYLTTELIDELVTEAGDNIVTEALDEIITDGFNLEETEDLVFVEIPREWSAAHIKRIWIVLLVDDAALVGYPPRLVGEPGMTVGRSGPPVILIHEEAA